MTQAIQSDVSCQNCEACCCRLEVMLFTDTGVPDPDQRSRVRPELVVWDRSRIRQRFQSPKRQRARSLFATR